MQCVYSCTRTCTSVQLSRTKRMNIIISNTKSMFHVNNNINNDQLKILFNNDKLCIWKPIVIDYEIVRLI